MTSSPTPLWRMPDWWGPEGEGLDEILSTEDWVFQHLWWHLDSNWPAETFGFVSIHDKPRCVAFDCVFSTTLIGNDGRAEAAAAIARDLCRYGKLHVYFDGMAWAVWPVLRGVEGVIPTAREAERTYRAAASFSGRCLITWHERRYGEVEPAEDSEALYDFISGDDYWLEMQFEASYNHDISLSMPHSQLYECCEGCPSHSCRGSADGTNCRYCLPQDPPIDDRWVAEHVWRNYRTLNGIYHQFRFIQRVYQPRVTGNAPLPESGALIVWNEKRHAG